MRTTHDVIDDAYKEGPNNRVEYIAMVRNNAVIRLYEIEWEIIGQRPHRWMAGEGGESLWCALLGGLIATAQIKD